MKRYKSKTSEIYPPGEDSLLLSKTLEKELSKIDKNNLKFLEIGTGSGIQLETILKSGIKKENIFSCDINKNAILFVKSKGFNCIFSDLFSNIKGTFDFIVFNAPYLPEDRFDKGIDTTGGKKGSETIIKFLRQSKEHLNKNGKIFIVLSSLSNLREIEREINSLGYKSKILDKKNFFFEEIFIFLLEQ